MTQFHKPDSEPVRNFHNSDMERAVLACIMIDAKAAPKAMMMITSPEVFYEWKHQMVFRAMGNLFNGGQGIDAITVSDELGRMELLEKVGGDSYIGGLMGEVITGANIEQHAKRIIDCKTRRDLAKHCGMFDVLNNMAIPATEVGVKIVELLINDIDQNRQRKIIKLDSAIVETIDDIGKRKAAIASGNSHLIKTGFPSLDYRTGGFEPGQLWVVAALPSMGKSDTMMNLSRNVAGRGHTVGIVSAEMSVASLTRRLISIHTDVNSLEMRSGTLSEDSMKIICRSSDYWRLPIYIDDRSRPTAADIRATAMMMVAQHGIKVLFIDHLFECKPRATDNEGWIELVSNIKSVGRDLGITTVLLTQLNKLNANDLQHKPILKDLRHGTDAAADVVLMLYRENYQESCEQCELEIITRKSREGLLGTTKCLYMTTTGKQGELENSYSGQDYRTYTGNVVEPEEALPF